MKAHVLPGTREEIVERLSHIDGDIREVVVMVDEPAVEIALSTGASNIGDDPELDMFKEMEPYMVAIDLDDVDCSRESIYTPQPGE